MEQPYPPQYAAPGLQAPEPTYREPTFGIGAVLGNGFSLLFRRVHVFFVLMVVLYAPLYLYGALRGQQFVTGEELNTEGWIFSGLSILLYGALQVAVTYAVVEEMSGRRAGIGRCLSVALTRMLPLLLLLIVLVVLYIVVAIVAVMIGVGLAKISPFFMVLEVGFVMLWFWACLYVVLPTLAVERNGVFGAIGRAWVLTRGNRWRIVGLLLVLMLIMFLAFLGIGAFASANHTRGELSWPLLIMGMVVYFLALVGNAVFSAVAYALLRNDKDGVGAGDLAKVFE